jgi:Undecaprenyl-phosphate glucose phosphotransferase
MLKQHANKFSSIIVVIDLLILILAYIFSRYIVFSELSISTWNLEKIIIVLFLIFILFITLERFEFSNLYRFHSFFDIIKSIFNFELVLIASFYICILFRIYNFKNAFVFWYVILTSSAFIVVRMLLKISLNILRRSGYNYVRYLIVGAGNVGINFYKKISQAHELGIKIEGFLDDDTSLKTTTKKEYTGEIKKLILSTTDDIEKVIDEKMIDNVVIALPMRSEEKIIKIANICENKGVKAELIPDYFKIVSANPSINQIKGFPLIGIRKVPLDHMFNKFIKRLFDICFAVGGLIVCLPIFIFVIIGIKISSPGPIFFRQKRTGYKQHEFQIIKFRSMLVNDQSDEKQATKDDPRKTKFGDFLRKTNLDELPQLINILIGDMSAIGPRPHMLSHTEEFNKKHDKYLVRHWVKPGLTGWAQVNGWRGDSDIGIRLKYDIEYIEKWTIWFDLKIVFLTVFGRKVKRNAV